MTPRRRGRHRGKFIYEVPWAVARIHSGFHRGKYIELPEWRVLPDDGRFGRFGDSCFDLADPLPVCPVVEGGVVGDSG